MKTTINIRVDDSEKLFTREELTEFLKYRSSNTKFELQLNNEKWVKLVLRKHKANICDELGQSHGHQRRTKIIYDERRERVPHYPVFAKSRPFAKIELMVENIFMRCK